MARRSGGAIEELEIPGGLQLTVVQETASVDIWLDAQASGKQSGVNIGTGRTVKTAKLDAKNSLRAAMAAIEESEMEG